MFAAYRMAKAQTACVNALRPFLMRPSWHKPWPAHFWSDPFVIGFLTTVVAMVTQVATGGKLKGEQQGLVLIGALKDCNGYSPEFKDRWMALIKEEDADLDLGMLHARKLVTFVMGLSPMDGDPHVDVARQIAEGTSITGGRIQPGDVGGALSYLLFHNVVEKRLGLDE